MSNLDNIYSDIFPLKDPNYYSSSDSLQQDFTLSPSKLVSNFSGLFKVEDSSLYLLSETSFYSCRFEINKFSSKPFTVSSKFKTSEQGKDFLIESGKIFILYPKKILVMTLQENQKFYFIESKTELYSIISLRGNIFTSSGLYVFQVQERFLYIFFTAPKQILAIKPSFYNSNCILIVMDQMYLIVNNESDVVFEYESENPCDVDFFNEHHLVFYDKFKNELYFIEWADSNEHTAEISLNSFEIMEMKVKENLVVLFDKEVGLLVCVIFCYDNNSFSSFSGIIENSFNDIDFDSNELTSQSLFGQFDGFSNLNFILSRENNLYSFSIKLSLEENSGICFFFKFSASGLDQNSQMEKIPVFEKPQPIDPSSVFRLKEEIIPNPDILIRKEEEIINLRRDKQRNCDFKGGNREKDFVSEMREIFSNENLLDIMRETFELVLPLKPKECVKIESFFDMQGFVGIQKIMKDISSRL
jgi:hypothetical protein